MHAPKDRLKPPGPKGIPILGNAMDVDDGDILQYNYKLWREYGDIYQTQMGPVASIVVSHPDYIQHVLVKNADNYPKGFTVDKFRMALGNGIFNVDGAQWRKQRRLMQPMYTPRNIEQYANIMTETSLEVMERWSALEGDAEVDINHEMVLATMTIISRAMFSMDLEGDFREVGEALHGFLDWVSSSTLNIFSLPLSIPTPKNQRLKRHKEIVREFIFNIIEERRRSGHKDDLLSLLMAARDEDTGEPMSDEQLHDEVLITFFAGHETTATTLTWAWYLLSQHPEIEAKFHHELLTVLNGRTPTLDDMGDLTYTRMIVDETLRLYSPVSVTARVAEEDDEIGGYHIPAGSMILVLPYATHRHPDYWEYPLAFYPDHFTEAATNARPRYAYYPFGAGRRICIGIHFALIEAVLVLATIGQQFQPKLNAVNHGAVDFVGVLRPADPVLMALKQR